ncbi:MAG: outer membrane lipoprotein carrier protein LolA [Desulfomonile tiedjei]|nr:outer membrane lipoprotein carrier protein LolA [Desulfomonile tiedjei]
MRVIRELRFRLTCIATSLGRLLPRSPSSRGEGVGRDFDRAQSRRRQGGLPYLRSPALLVLCAALLGACSGTGPVRVSDFEDLVQSMEAKSRLVDRFKTTFVKTRLSDVFNRALTIRGSLVFQKPNKFQLTMTGDVNVELLSDGARITVIHDQRDRETFEVQGDRDIARFADPLMALIESIGNGGLREFRAVQAIEEEPSLLVQGEPRGQRYFERIERVTLVLNESGQIRKVTLLFKDGNRDETIFQDWQALASDHPDIQQLDERLSRIMPERSPVLALTATAGRDRSEPQAPATFPLAMPTWAQSLLCRLGFTADLAAAESPDLSKLSHRSTRSPR